MPNICLRFNLSGYCGFNRCAYGKKWGLSAPYHGKTDLWNGEKKLLSPCAAGTGPVSQYMSQILAIETFFCLRLLQTSDGVLQPGKSEVFGEAMSQPGNSWVLKLKTMTLLRPSVNPALGCVPFKLALRHIYSALKPHRDPKQPFP